VLGGEHSKKTADQDFRAPLSCKTSRTNNKEWFYIPPCDVWKYMEERLESGKVEYNEERPHNLIEYLSPAEFVAKSNVMKYA
jgi:hypothetical protein